MRWDLTDRVSAAPEVDVAGVHRRELDLRREPRLQQLQWQRERERERQTDRQTDGRNT